MRTSAGISGTKSFARMMGGLLALLLPMAASGQTVFFDDFEGNTLLPHWQQPPASRWEYNVSNSRLNVTKLLYPSNPHSPSNFATMAALFAPQTDFRMDARMGWDAGAGPRRLGMEVRTGAAATGIIASIRYSDEGGPGVSPVIVAGAFGSPNLITMPAPAPGIYRFAISRVGAEFRFYFDGSLFGSLIGNNIPTTGVVFEFAGPFPGELGTLRIDRIQVIPSPGSALFVFTLALGCGRASRKQKRT